MEILTEGALYEALSEGKSKTHTCLYIPLYLWRGKGRPGLHAYDYLCDINITTDDVDVYSISLERNGTFHRLVGCLVPNDVAALYILHGMGEASINAIPVNSYSEWTDAIVAI